MEGDYGTGAFVSCGHSSPPGRIAARRSGVAQRFVSRPPGYSLHNRQTEHPRLRPPLGRSKAVSAARRCRSGSRIELPDFVAPPLCLCWSLYRVGLLLRAHYCRAGCESSRPFGFEPTFKFGPPRDLGGVFAFWPTFRRVRQRDGPRGGSLPRSVSITGSEPLGPHGRDLGPKSLRVSRRRVPG
jgi:hypothetical protein